MKNTSLFCFATISLITACTSIKTSSLYIPPEQVNHIEKCPVTEGEGWTVMDKLELSACGYSINNIDYDFLDNWADFTSRTSIGLNGIGVTWDEDGEIVSYDFDGIGIHVDKEGDFAGVINNGTGLVWNEVIENNKNFTFKTRLSETVVAESVCFYFSESQAVSLFDGGEEIFGFMNKPDEIFTCQGLINNQHYQMHWNSTDNKFDLIVNQKHSTFYTSQPTKFVIDNRITNYPFPMAFCIEKDDEYQTCVSNELPSEHIYLKNYDDIDTRSALITSLFAFKIIEAIGKNN